LAAGQSDAALADSELAVDDGAAPAHLFHRARVLMMNGQPTSARASLKQALERGLAEENLNSLEAADFRGLMAKLEPTRN
jgi:hypothetical protein